MLDANDLWFQFCVKHAPMNDDSKIRTLRSKYESSRIVAELSGWLNRETNRAFVRLSDSKDSKNLKNRERKGTTNEVRDRGHDREQHVHACMRNTRVSALRSRANRGKG